MNVIKPMELLSKLATSDAKIELCTDNRAIVISGNSGTELLYIGCLKATHSFRKCCGVYIVTDNDKNIIVDLKDNDLSATQKTKTILPSEQPLMKLMYTHISTNNGVEVYVELSLSFRDSHINKWKASLDKQVHFLLSGDDEIGSIRVHDNIFLSVYKGVDILYYGGEFHISNGTDSGQINNYTTAYRLENYGKRQHN